MLYNALTFKLSLLYFCNWLVIIAQQDNVSEVINSDYSPLCLFVISEIKLETHRLKTKQNLETWTLQHDNDLKM